MQYQPQQFPQPQPQFIIESNHDQESLLKKEKYKSSKGMLICLLALPIIFFITCLILFIIMISYQHSNTVSVDRAISTTEQFGKDLNDEAWNNFAVEYDAACATGYKKLEFDEFQGIDEGQIEQVTLHKEYKEIDMEDSCSGLCKKEKGIGQQTLIELSKHTTGAGRTLLVHKHHLCYKTVSFDKYEQRTGTNCPTGYTKCLADKTQFCRKTADGNDNNCPIVHLKPKTVAAASNTGLVSGTGSIQSAYETNDNKKQIVIGMVGGFSRPCKNPEFKSALPKEHDYPLLGIQYNQCDEYGSYDKEQTPELYNTLNYKSILELNGISATAKPSPYFYDFIDNVDLKDKYKIYAKHRPNVKHDATCSPTEMQSLGLVRKYLNGTNRALFVYTLIGLILSGLGILFWLALIGMTFTATRKKSKKSSSQMLKVMHIIGIILAILLIVFYIHYFSVADENFEKIEKTKDMFAKTDGANCYSDAGDWKTAVDKVYNFVWTAIEISRPLIITFFIVGIVYLALILIVMAATKAKGVSPCYPPYINYLQ